MKNMNKIITYSILIFFIDVIISVSLYFLDLDIGFYYIEKKYLLPYVYTNEIFHNIFTKKTAGIYPEPTLWGYFFILFSASLGVILNFVLIVFYRRFRS